MALRTIVLLRHESNLARPVIIHDNIIHGRMCQVLHVVDFLGSRRMATAPTSIEVLLRPTQSQSHEPSDLRGSLSPTSVYSTCQFFLHLTVFKCYSYVKLLCLLLFVCLFVCFISTAALIIIIYFHFHYNVLGGYHVSDFKSLNDGLLLN